MTGCRFPLSFQSSRCIGSMMHTALCSLSPKSLWPTGMWCGVSRATGISVGVKQTRACDMPIKVYSTIDHVMAALLMYLGTSGKACCIFW